MSESESILVGIAAGKALVGHIEEGEVLLLLDDLGDLHPLLLSGVNASRVVCACVEEDNAALGHLLEVLDQAIVVKANGVLVVVPVLLDLQAGVLEDGVVVCPRGVRDIDGLIAGIVAFQESTTDAKGTSTGDGLGDNDAALLDGRRARTVCELESCLGEIGDTSNAGVLLVQSRLYNLLLGLPDGWQNVGLALVVAVCANTCIG